MPRTGEKPFKAVMFDLDGTLIESTIDFMRFRARLIGYIEAKGADMSGYGMEDTSVALISKFAKEMRRNGRDAHTVESYLDEIDAFIDEIELDGVEGTRPTPGAEDLLRCLRRDGIKIGVLTRGSPVYAEKALRISGLAGYIDAVVARDRKSGIPPKPDPRSAFALAEKLGVGIEESIIVGDYSIDFTCAKEAKIRFYGIASDDESKRSLVECGCSDVSPDIDALRKKMGV